MTNAIVPTNVKIPAHLAKYAQHNSGLSSAISAGIGGSGPEYPRISIKGSRFRIVEEGQEHVLPETTLNVVIVGANPNLSKAWYAKAWNPDDEPAGPDCYSLNGLSPHLESQNPQSDKCSMCKQNQWGSKITPAGQKIKACSDKKRLAVVAANDPSGPVYLLEVTPAALKGLSQYQRELTTRGIMLEIVTTAVSFDTDASFPKLKFAFAGFNSEETQEAVTPLFGSESVMEITGEAQPERLEVAPIQPAKPVLVRATNKPAPNPAPVEETVEEVEVEVIPPKVATKARGFGGAAANGQVDPTPAKGGAASAKKVAKEPAPVASASLADEIASLIGDMGDDD
jgi:hypothetical protein